MKEIIIILIGVLISTVGVVMIYDARSIAKDRFSSNEINETTKLLKIVGFIVALIGALIIYFL